MDGEVNVNSVPTSKESKKLTVEKIYQKKSQLEHILLRPDTYIGSVQPVTQTMWVYDGEDKGMVCREVTFVPGLYKIFDEILVNAADNKQRDKKMDVIKVDIDQESNVISVYNNGKGIPVTEHKDEKMYVPTLIFGHLLTSSNYNDEEEKVTGGRNGYGAKLCNIFSTKFVVETASEEYGLLFKQTWADNMSKTSDAKVKSFGGDDYTKVTFNPDLRKFNMTRLDDDIVALMSRRAYDVAGTTGGVKVYLNGKRLPVKGFKDYVEQYTKDKEDEVGNPLKIVYERFSERWEVAVTVSEHGFQQVSFVNSIATTKGGRHVDYVVDQLVSKIIESVKKKNKGGIAVKPFQVKSHIWIFVNCLIVNPTFDSQTKENMTLGAKNFGSKCQLTDKFVGNALKSGVVEAVMTWAKFKAQAQLNTKCSTKKQTKLKGIPKLEDANDAGTKQSVNCTLILTEGDSAKSLAVSGLSVVGRDKYGVFPLKGKLLNVREATHKQILENAEINNIIKILGLQYKKKYESIEDLKSLRYGKLMIMTDQDQDGSHIKGLLINFIHHNWPTLLNLPFLEEFITPIVKASRGNENYSFYSLPEFEEWKASRNDWNKFKVKYYKGLGTSTSKEAKEYFNDMHRHRIKFKHHGQDDDQSIIMAFSKKCVEQRKEWLTNGMEERKRRKEIGLPEIYLYGKETTTVSYRDFVNKELILFSNLDNERSIPSLVDGLKPGQRKVLYTCLKRNDKREIKVAQLAGSVAEHSAYHHGEASLMGTIINLAQNFVGSNNINILQPIGQFGTRLQGGKDAASPRYIFTMLSPLARMLFNPHDEPLLNHLYDDNQKIEPEYYVPIIPMILVNGADGIGTGWMTKIPNYNPREITDNLKKMIHGEKPRPMKPWFKGFRGNIEGVDVQKFVVNGEISILPDNRLEITELPVRTWTQAYKESVIEPFMHGSEKIPPLITDYREHHSDTTVKFVVTMSEDKLAKAEEDGLHKVFKLQSIINTTSMVLFDKNGVLRRFDGVEDILQEFFEVRLQFYIKRKEYLVGMLKAESSKLSNQARFILEKCDGKLVVENKKKKVMIDELVKRGYDSDPVKAWKYVQNKKEALEEEADVASQDETEPLDASRDFDYLLGMTMWSLTLEKKEELLKKRDMKLEELNILQKKSPEHLWEADLDEFLLELNKVEQKELEEESGKPSKASSKLMTGKSRKQAADIYPDPHGRRIEPFIDAELRKKVEKAAAAKENKSKKKVKEDGEEEDLFDGENVKPLSERVSIGSGAEKKKKSAGEPKKPRAPRGEKKVSPKKKKGKEPWESSSDSEANGSSDDSWPKSAPVKERIQRRAASKVKYNYESDGSGKSSSDEEVLKENVLVQQDADVPDVVSDLDESNLREKNQAPAVSDSDDEFGFMGSKKQKKPQFETSAEDMFDSLIGETESKPIEKPKVQKPATNGQDKPAIKRKLLPKDPSEGKKKRAPAKKKKLESDSNMSDFGSDDSNVPKKKKRAPAKKKKPKSDEDNSDFGSDHSDAFKKKKKAPARKKKAESDSDGSGFDDEPAVKASDVAPRGRTGRTKAPIKYNFGGGDSDEDSF